MTSTMIKIAAALLLVGSVLAPRGATQAVHEVRPAPRWQADPLPPGAVARLGWRVDWNHASNGRSLLAAFSPDGTLLAAADGPGVALWEVKTGRLRWRLRSASPPVHTVGFGPGNTVLALARGAVHVWDAATGKEVRTFRVIQDWDAAAFSPDGRLLAACRRVWDLATGKELYPTEGRNASVSFSADGRLLVLSWTDYERNPAEKVTGHLRICEAATGKLLRSHDQPGEAIEYAALSPDGSTVVAAGYAPPRTHFVRLLDRDTGKELRRFAEGDEGRIHPRFSPDGKYVTVYHLGTRMHVWEAATGRAAFPVTLAHTVLFSPDGKLIAGANQDGRVWLCPWELRGKPGRNLAPGHYAWPGALAFSADGSTLVSGAADEGLCWDLRRGEVTRSFKLSAPHPKEMAITPDGRHLLVRHWGGLNVYDLERGQELSAFKRDTLQCFSADGGALVGTGPPLAGVRYVPYRYDPHADSFPIALTPTGDLLVQRLSDLGMRFQKGFRAGLDYAGMRLRDSASMQVLTTLPRHPARGQPPGVGDIPLVFSPDGKMMASLLISAENGPRVLVAWETQTGRERLRIATFAKGSVALAFSPDGRLLAFAENAYQHAGPVRLVDLTLGKEVGKPLPSASRSLAFSSDTKLLASGEEDASILLWDMAPFRAAPPAKPLAVAEFDRLWADLGSDDGGRAYRAVVRCLASPERATALLCERIAWGDVTHEAKRLLADLGSSAFKTREKAAAGLEAFGDRARPVLRQALADPKLSLEQRRRVEKLLARLGTPFASPAGIRLFRALEILERVGNRQAVELLRAMSAGPVNEPLTLEARRALARLRKRG